VFSEPRNIAIVAYLDQVATDALADTSTLAFILRAAAEANFDAMPKVKSTLNTAPILPAILQSTRRFNFAPQLTQSYLTLWIPRQTQEFLQVLLKI